MKRRLLLQAAAAMPLAAPAWRVRAEGAGDAPSDAGWRRFELTTRITLADPESPATLWVPLAETLGDYQRAEAPRWTSGGQSSELVRDERYGAPMLRVAWRGAPGAHTADIVQVVSARDRAAAEPASLSPAERDFWTAPTASLPTDGIVRATAERVTAGIEGDRARLRALHEWVVERTFRDPETRGCGTGDIRALLESGRLGGKCADINGLMVGLARAAGIPARDVYGIRVAGSRQYPCLGTSGATVTKAQHCRAEAFVEGAGWLPLDPADVRKVVLEAKLPVDDPGVAALRARSFGAWEGNWVGFNHATDIALPGAPHPMNANFLMYPCAMTPNGEADCLDPAGFRYDIASRQVAA
ncbi:MAG: transglutaminase domain-containing protein [Acetobacteraceae bacterium]|nr:transglutaminase domain-containing protein [Acetobacteraceae bacterium]